MAEIKNEPVASVIEDLYPLAQVAKILRCSRKSVYRLISSGRLNAVRWGRSYRFRREDIQRFLKSSAINGSKTQPAETNVLGAISSPNGLHLSHHDRKSPH
jgi:excisionase family DNA binding protein